MKGQLRARLEAFGIHPKKGLGQNFLHDPSILTRIVEAVATPQPEGILEIGPGPGLLTERLAEMHRPMVAVEKDAALLKLLSEEFGTRYPHLSLVDGDFLRVDIKRLFPHIRPLVVGNIPYNISSPIVLRLLEQRGAIGDAVLMLQAELAQRLRTPVGSRAAGSLTVLISLLASVELVTPVPAGAFFPPPKVQSEVIRLRWRSQPLVPVHNITQFERTVRTGFNQRRKKLANALSAAWKKELVNEALSGVGIDPNLRAEHLVLRQWAQLANALGALEKPVDRSLPY